jgi:diguanylate cyclase (GGDEF)-like protein
MTILPAVDFNAGTGPDTNQILLVEDEPDEIRLMGDMLAGQPKGTYEIQLASRVHEALIYLHEERFAAVLLDLFLPDSSGMHTFKHVLTAAPDLPIIIITGMAEQALASQAVQGGAQEYLVKEEMTSALLLRALRSAIGRMRSESDRYFAASYDPLTKLPNRLLFQDRLAHTLERARRDQIKKNAKWKVAVLLLDLDHFRTVNDRWGHVEGSILLQNVAERLRNCFRKADTVARTGSDEFTLLFESLESNEEAIQLAKKVQSVFQKPFLLNDQAIMVTVSIGIGIFPDQGKDVESLLQNASLAMRRARRYGNCYYCFTPWG